MPPFPTHLMPPQLSFAMTVGGRTPRDPKSLNLTRIPHSAVYSVKTEPSVSFGGMLCWSHCVIGKIPKTDRRLEGASWFQGFQSMVPGPLAVALWRAEHHSGSVWGAREGRTQMRTREGRLSSIPWAVPQVTQASASQRRLHPHSHHQLRPGFQP